MTEWKKYEGTDEQIAEIMEYGREILVDSQYSVFSDPRRMILNKDNPEDVAWIRNHFKHFEVTKYLICNRHPQADMISQQAQTGQPVWIKITIDCEYGGLPIKDISVQVTTTPDWNIPGAEYSFTPFEDKK